MRTLSSFPAQYKHSLLAGSVHGACCDAGDQPAQLAGHADTVAVVAFDPSGALLATGGMDGAVHVWHASSGELACALEGPTDAITCLHWHPRGTVLLAGSEDMLGWMFNADKQQCMQVFSGHSGPLAGGARVVPSDKLLLRSQHLPGDSGECTHVRLRQPSHSSAGLLALYQCCTCSSA